MLLNKSKLYIIILSISILLFLIGVVAHNAGDENSKNIFNILFILGLVAILFLRIPTILNIAYFKRSIVHILLIVFSLLYLNGLESIESLENYVNLIRLFIVFYTFFVIAKYIPKLQNKDLFYLSFLLLMVTIFYLCKSFTMSYDRLTFIGQSNTTAQIFYIMIILNIILLMKIEKYKSINYLSTLLLYYLVLQKGSRTIMIVMPILLFFLYYLFNQRSIFNTIFLLKYTIVTLFFLVSFTFFIYFDLLNIESKRYLTYATYIELLLTQFNTQYYFNGIDSQTIEMYFLGNDLKHPIYQVPHNSLLIILVKSGLFSMLAYLSLHLVLIIKMIKIHQSYFNSKLSSFTISSAISCFIIGLVENSFVEVSLLYSYYFYAVAAIYTYVEYKPNSFRKQYAS